MNTLSSVNLVGRPKNNPRSFFSTSILQSAPRVAGAFSVFAEAEWEFAAWKEAMPPAGGGGWARRKILTLWFDGNSGYKTHAEGGREHCGLSEGVPAMSP